MRSFTTWVTPTPETVKKTPDMVKLKRTNGQQTIGSHAQMIGREHNFLEQGLKIEDCMIMERERLHKNQRVS